MLGFVWTFASRIWPGSLVKDVLNNLGEHGAILRANPIRVEGAVVKGSYFLNSRSAGPRLRLAGPAAFRPYEEKPVECPG